MQEQQQQRWRIVQKVLVGGVMGAMAVAAVSWRTASVDRPPDLGAVKALGWVVVVAAVVVAAVAAAAVAALLLRLHRTLQRSNTRTMSWWAGVFTYRTSKLASPATQFMT